MPIAKYSAFFLAALLIILTEAVNAETIELTATEKEWLSLHKTLRMSGPQAFPPFQYMDKDGTFKGMATDYLLHIAEELGLNIVMVEKQPWPDILEKTKNKEIDILACVADTQERRAFLNYSNAHLSFPLVIITQKNAPPIHDHLGLRNKKVAQVKNNATHEWLSQNGVTFTGVNVSSPLEGLKAVSLGRADAIIENLAAASYLIEKEGLTNLKIATDILLDDYALYIGVRKDWPELVPILNKALAAISKTTHDEIRQKWIPVRYEYGLQLIDIIKWVALVSLIALSMLGIFYKWNRQLAREIEDRKKAEQEKEQLITDLTSALEEIKTLRGILPICSHCKRIRDDKGYWTRIETYIAQHSEADFSHSICPACYNELYSKEEWFGKKSTVSQGEGTVPLT
ncbi:transporter substrate-binding domain-containing protein [Desulfogranum japonicum]|uniref:transporter substrate-binding domain-containing protein n=1 Tax=Desulfogranum japonicum TaxID=231447 RepID=UPI00041CCAAB|nr:transporter substrate-binding domain-containing protein [Desulfogranum japonicum]